MKKSELEHIQRSRFLESGQKVRKQVETIVRSINLKYPELAGKIEIQQADFFQAPRYSESDALMRYLKIFMNQNLLA